MREACSCWTQGSTEIGPATPSQLNPPPAAKSDTNTPRPSTATSDTLSPTMNFPKNNAFATNLHFDQVRMAAAMARNDRDGQRGDNQAAVKDEDARLVVVKAVAGGQQEAKPNAKTTK